MGYPSWTCDTINPSWSGGGVFSTGMRPSVSTTEDGLLDGTDAVLAAGGSDPGSSAMKTVEGAAEEDRGFLAKDWRLMFPIADANS